MTDKLEIRDPYKVLVDLSQKLLPPLRKITWCVIADPLFQYCPGGTRHHFYKGGLLQHTAEVAVYASRMIPGGDPWHIVTAAAIIHDYRKIDEYIILDDGRIIDTDYRKTTGHVVGGFLFFRQSPHFNDLPGNIQEEISHALLAHHGRREWGSPVEPRTETAFALHAADMLSVQGATIHEALPQRR